MAIDDGKSIITCDLEGRIETFSNGAEKMFGYAASEVIGRKRVSLFSPGLVVLQHVPHWLSEASTKGAHEARTVFVRKDGTPFAAQIRVTPTKKNGKQIGFCGVTQVLEGVSVAEAMPPIALKTRIFSALVITRAPFLTAMLVPLLVGAAWVSARGLASPFPWGSFALALVGGLALHVAANTFNDYFDGESGADEANTEYFLPYSGGSRSIELGLVTPRGLWRIAISALVVAAACGAALIAQRGFGALWFGLAGAASAYFYTAPPLRLVARKGVGELLVGLNFGPLASAGMAWALTGEVHVGALLAGLPVGLLTSAILFINEFPDMASDAATGKNHLVVVLGKERARWGFAAILTSAFVLLGVLVAQGALPVAALVACLTIPMAWLAARIALREYASRALVRANALTIQLHLATGLLLAAGVAWG